MFLNRGVCGADTLSKGSTAQTVKAVIGRDNFYNRQRRMPSGRVRIVLISFIVVGIPSSPMRLALRLIVSVWNGNVDPYALRAKYTWSSPTSLRIFRAKGDRHENNARRHTASSALSMGISPRQNGQRPRWHRRSVSRCGRSPDRRRSSTNARSSAKTRSMWTSCSAI